MKVRNIEEEIAKNNSRKTQEFRKKWNVLALICKIYDLFKISQNILFLSSTHARLHTYFKSTI